MKPQDYQKVAHGWVHSMYFLALTQLRIICKQPVSLTLRKLAKIVIFHTRMPILDWEPAPGGTDALAALQPLFPPATLDEHEINSLTQWMYEQ